ncbi:hypothetical protein DCAR_0102388 [Daucus carota subsp. sativus]|uniref:Uncharacterized protein n=2 Tax=Daucus carota subsp. sativus TaxID=79200 RepID=A0AAF0W6E4_DAUCS|nr:PREDICTED: uncharacterized protein LOC108205110 [Daucus carota subsp. sativus]WOG83214.1 hypothetical protein DCAR_0102388 [Daucus carota subsp. sativus]
MKSTEDNNISNELIQRMKPEHILLLDSKVPKQFISFDEQYLRRCLEFIQITANKPTTCSLDSDFTVFSETKNMLDILNSPLFHKLGSTIRDRSSLVDLRNPKCSSLLCSPSESDSSTSGKSEKDLAVHNDHANVSDHVPKSVGPLSTPFASAAAHLSSFMPATSSRWMLHNRGNQKCPHYVFSSDNQRDIYFANLSKVDSPNKKVTDYMYAFLSRAAKRKEGEMCEQEFNLIGRMKVSSSITILSDGTEVMETSFVLYGFDDNCVEERQTKSHNLEKSKGLSVKMSGVLKGSRTFRRRRSMRLDVSTSMKDINSRQACEGAGVEDHFTPNLELAAIVVKEHISPANKNVKVGGWGLKFLNKTGQRHLNASLQTEVPLQCHSHSNSNCSTSIDIIIPASFHGLPRSKTGSPSSLIDRWISGGKCDCGGWDMGCALTILQTKQTEAFCLAKTFDIFAEGSKKDLATMKMVNVRDGSYCIPFQSTLSALQSFSIAVAILHAQIHSPNRQLSIG